MSYILLLSANGDQATGRHFKEFITRDELARSLIEIYEDYLETIVDDGTGEETNLQYSSDDLMAFVENSFGELVCLEKQPDDHSDLWIPYAPSWIKESIYIHLRNAAEQTEELEETAAAVASEAAISNLFNGQTDRENQMVIETDQNPHEIILY